MTSIRAPTSSSADTESLFANVRASLRHAPTPVEVPINSVVYGGAPRMRRTGQPTVNVPSDKMAAFLTEMKTVRLRKVGGGLTEAQGSGSGVGEKRKRDGYSAEEVQAVKRRQTMAPVEITRQHSSDLLSRSFSGLPSTHSLPGPSSLSQSLQPSSIRNWPSVTGDGADLATPSLTSDGDLDGENSLEERLPPTPPIIPLNEIRGPIRVPSINKPLGGEEISDISIANVDEVDVHRGLRWADHILRWCNVFDNTMIQFSASPPVSWLVPGLVPVEKLWNLVRQGTHTAAPTVGHCQAMMERVED